MFHKDILKDILPCFPSKILPFHRFEGMSKDLTLSCLGVVTTWANKIDFSAEMNIQNLIDTIYSEFNTKKEKPSKTIFISYAQSNSSTADFIEICLRRNNIEIKRDNIDLDTGDPIWEKIKNLIDDSSIFLAIYDKEYACSHWCYDELEYAIENEKEIWLFKTDSTSVINPKFRHRLNEEVKDRKAIEHKITALLHKNGLLKNTNMTKEGTTAFEIMNTLNSKEQR